MVLYANTGLLHRHYCNIKVDEITCPICDRSLLTHPSIMLDNLPLDRTCFKKGMVLIYYLLAPLHTERHVFINNL